MAREFDIEKIMDYVDGKEEQKLDARQDFDDMNDIRDEKYFDTINNGRGFLYGHNV